MRRLVVDALTTAGLDTPDVESIVADQLDATVCRWIVLEYVCKIARHLRRKRPEDPRQGWLGLPEYEHIPVAVADDSLEELRARIVQMERRIKQYDYMRRALEKRKGDERQLRDMKRLEKTVAPYFVGHPKMTVSRAVLAHQEYLQSPVAKRNRKGAQRRNAKSAA